VTVKITILRGVTTCSLLWLIATSVMEKHAASIFRVGALGKVWLW